MQHSSSFDRILGILCSVLDAHSAALFLPEGSSKGEERELFMASSFSLGNRLNYSAVIHEGKGLVGWILRNREPLLVANFDQRQNRLGYYLDNEEHNIKAFMGCSFADGAGVLCVDSKRQYSFAEKDQKLLHLFADLIGHLRTESGNTDEYSAAVKYYSALRTIYTLRHQYSRWADFLKHFLGLMASVTGCGYAALCTRDPDGRGYSVEGESAALLQKNGAPGPSFPMTHGVVGWVFRNAAQVTSGGPDGSPETPLMGSGADMPHFQTVIAHPLVIQRKTRGVLCLAHDVPMEISGNTKDFVRMASEHLALFLENLYVKCRLRDLHQMVQPGDPSILP